MNRYFLCISVCFCVTLTTSTRADSISDHIFSVDITQGIDYGYPGQNDTVYNFNLSVETGTAVTSVSVECPGGASFGITQIDTDDGVIDTDFDDEGDHYEWEYTAELPAYSNLDAYGDGDYIITVHFESEPSLNTGVPFYIPATSNHIPQPIQEPVLISTIHGSTVQSPVSFQWQPVVDSNVNYVHLLLYNRVDQSEIEGLLTYDQTQWGPRVLSDGLYELEIAFANAYFLEDDQGIDLILAKYTEIDNEFTVGPEQLYVSGVVIDKYSRSPLINIPVGCWHIDLQQWKQTYTDQQGRYMLLDLAPGTVEIKAVPNGYYAEMGRRIELTETVTDLNFELPEEAIVSGRVVDSESAVGIADVEVMYWNENYVTWRYDVTDNNGNFNMTGMPPGSAHFDLIPPLNSGYALLPDDTSAIFLNEGEFFINRYFVLEKGARVTGRIVDTAGNPVPDAEISAGGMKSDHNYDVDEEGQYEMNLPPGKYNIIAEREDPDDNLGSTIQGIKISDSSQAIVVPDIVMYSAQTGNTISGTADIAGDVVYDGIIVVLLPAGTKILSSDPDTWYTTRTQAEGAVNESGDFEIMAVPPGNYDVHLIAFKEIDEDTESITILDTAFNISAGTENVMLSADWPYGNIEGTVLNSSDLPVSDAVVLINDESPEDEMMKAFGETDTSGQFIIYNVPQGQYTISALHSQYDMTSSTVSVTADQVTNFGNLTIQFNGIKKGPDLTGDGSVDIQDLMQVSEQWLGQGSLPASLRSGSVNMLSLARFAKFWMHQAAWLR